MSSNIIVTFGYLFALVITGVLCHPRTQNFDSDHLQNHICPIPDGQTLKAPIAFYKELHQISYVKSKRKVIIIAGKKKKDKIYFEKNAFGTCIF